MAFIITNEAKCRDCYRCIRECPVKAIKISTNEKGMFHAKVMEEFCIHTGRCLLVCPQNAKVLPKKDLVKVKELLQQGETIAVAVAPSFVSSVPLSNPQLMPDLLRKLGFAIVQETSLGAGLVSQHHLQHDFEKPVISSSCPAVVNMVERYYPELIPMLSPVVSPMIAHGRYLKNTYPKHKVVFIGPCAAKKAEYNREELNDAVDYALGFNELWQLVQEFKIDLDSLKPSQFDNEPFGVYSLFPIEGGMKECLREKIKNPEEDFVSITGVNSCLDFMKDLVDGKIKNPPKIMELLSCRGGCINGPLSLCQDNSIYQRRRKVYDYYKVSEGTVLAHLPQIDPKQMIRTYSDQKVKLPYPTESELELILKKTGKYKKEDELNCGSCGYNSCREKAVAVFQGKAEVEMCIPYMRKRAESFSNIVTSTMPNGLIIVNEDLIVLEMNKAAERIFKCPADQLIGKPLNRMIDCQNFSRSIKSGKPLSACCEYPHKGVVTSEIIFPVKEEKIAVGIFNDVTEEKKRQENYELVKNQTIMQAQEVIDKQMKVAQEIAGLLGEATAETKIQLSRLIKLMREDPTRKE